MPATLFAQLTQAFQAKDTQTTRGLLERAAKQSADVIAAADQERLRGFCGALALVHIDTEAFELTPELRELRAYLAALVQLTRAALDRVEDLEAVRKAQPADYRPAILACIKKQGAPSHDGIAERLGVSPHAIEHPVRSLLSAKTITATTIEGAQCYALTPLGFVVARRLEERAGERPRPAQEAASPERPVLFDPEAQVEPPSPPEPEGPAPGEVSVATVELTAAHAAEDGPPEDGLATEDLTALDIGDAAAPCPDAMGEVIALDLEECEPAADDATVTEDLCPEDAPAAPAAKPPTRLPEAPAPTAVRHDTARTLARKRQHRKLRVAVLHGGISAERDVSLRSGEAVGEALRESGYQVEMIDVQEATLGELSPRRIDVAFVALRGTFGEDGGIQGVLDALGVPYTGSDAEASRLASDKIAAKRKLRVAGVPTPAFVELDASWPEPLKARAAVALGFPVVLKPTCEGSGLGVALAESREAVGEALDQPFKFDTRAFAEQFVSGREFTVAVLDGKPLPIIELIYDGPMLTYAVRQTPGAVRRVVEPALAPPLLARVRTYALAASEGLACRGCTRVDLRLDADGVPHVLEVNPLPPLAPDSLAGEAAAAAGIPFQALCERLVDGVARRAGGAG